MGDVYLWTCIDQKTKLMPSFMIGKRSADNARRFMMDVASRLVFPKPHASDDARASKPAATSRSSQISTDGFAAYPEAVDLAFGPYVEVRHDHQGIPQRQHDLHAVGNGRHQADRHSGHRRPASCARYAPATSSG